MRPIDFLLRSARRHPEKIAISGPEGEIGYAELLERTEALAAAFQALVPDARGRIAICAGNHISHVVALFATLLAGRIWVPLNPRAGQAELLRVLLKVVEGRPAAERDRDHDHRDGQAPDRHDGAQPAREGVARAENERRGQAYEQRDAREA